MKERRNQKKTQDKKKVNIVGILVILGIFLLVVYTCVYIVKLASVKTSDPTNQNGSTYYLLSKEKDDFEKTLFVFESGYNDDRKIEDVYLFLYNKEKGESLTIYIPGWLYTTGLEEDFGNAIPVSTFRYAGDFKQSGRGVEYAIWQIGQMLGMKFDNYVWFSTESVSIIKNIVGSLDEVKDSYKEEYSVEDGVVLSDSFFKLHTAGYKFSFPYGYFDIKDVSGMNGYIYSNISALDVFGLLDSVDKKVVETKSYGIDLSLSQYSTEELSEIGGLRRYFNTSSFDDSFRKIVSTMIDRDLEKERVRVEVYNGSGVSGSAKQFGRKIENAGCDVVRYENAPKIQEKTVVYVSKKDDFKKSLEVVDQVLSGKYEIVEGRPNFMTTGDIVVVLGQDIKLMYQF